jgi:hypothetical protein
MKTELLLFYLLYPIFITRMSFSLSLVHKPLRWLSLLLIPYFFILILVVLLCMQFTELGT